MAKVHVTAALFCERVLREEDGVNSAIRIVDTFTESMKVQSPVPVGTEVQDAIHAAPFNTNLSLFLAFWAEEAGAYDLSVSFEYADHLGEPADPFVHKLELAAHQGLYVKLLLATPFPRAGLLWARVDVDGETRTRSPLTLSRTIEP
jgi:hypothetical protein